MAAWCGYNFTAWYGYGLAASWYGYSLAAFWCGYSLPAWYGYRREACYGTAGQPDMLQPGSLVWLQSGSLVCGTAAWQPGVPQTAAWYS